MKIIKKIFKNDQLNITVSQLIIALLIFIFSLVISLVFIFICGKVSVDYQIHITYIKDFSVGKYNNGASLFYYIVAKSLFFINEIKSIQILKVYRIYFALIISTFLTIKYLIMLLIAKDFLCKNKLTKIAESKYLSLVIFWLYFIIPLPIHYGYFTKNYWYLTSFAITCWHNPTSIFMWPFSFLLFYFTYLYIKYRDMHFLVYCYIFMILNITIKPAFVLSWVPIFFLWMVFAICKEYIQQRIINKTFICHCVILLFISVLFLFGLQFLIYNDNTSKVLFGISPAIAYYLQPISSFKYWLVYVPSAFLATGFFPIGIFICVNNFKRFVFTDETMLAFFSFLSWIFGLFFMLFSYETGQRIYHINMSWTSIACAQIMYFWALLIGIIYWNNNSFSKVKRSILCIIFTIFLFQVICGLYYLSQIFSSGFA